MKITADDVYNKLISEDCILEKKGEIWFRFDDINLLVRQKDVVGNIMQEWLEKWFQVKGIDYSVNSNTQMPPDFYLDPESTKAGMLEVKAFNYKATPGFDIADFNMYQNEIARKPYMLDVDYLIFGYEMSEDGYVTIKKLWLKKVWNICSPSAKWPMKLQVKDNVVHKIRPCKWYSSSKRVKFMPFRSKEDFVSALEETVFNNPKTHSTGGTWRSEFRKNYKDFYGRKIDFPRWNEIEETYVVR